MKSPASSSSTRTLQCFTLEDDGLASLTELEQQSNSVLSCCGAIGVHSPRHPFFVRNSAKYGSVLGSPRKNGFGSGRVMVDPRFEDQCYQFAHFLEACSLCKKPLAGNRDIFMYRGDTPFCSEECRQEQIEIDEGKEKSWNLSASMKALRNKKETNTSSNSSSSSAAKNQNYAYHAAAGTVAAA